MEEEEDMEEPIWTGCVDSVVVIADQNGETTLRSCLVDALVPNAVGILILEWLLSSLLKNN